MAIKKPSSFYLFPAACSSVLCRVSMIHSFLYAFWSQRTLTMYQWQPPVSKTLRLSWLLLFLYSNNKGWKHNRKIKLSHTSLILGRPSFFRGPHRWHEQSSWAPCRWCEEWGDDWTACQHPAARPSLGPHSNNHRDRGARGCSTQAHHTQTACLHPPLPCWGTESFLLSQRANPWLLLVASLKRYKTLLKQLKAGGEGQRERNEDSQLGRAATQSTTNTSVLLQDDSIDTSQTVYSEKINKSWVTLPEPATSRLTITAN